LQAVRNRQKTVIFQAQISLLNMNKSIIPEGTTNETILTLSIIKNKIHRIRGYNVILDRDLATTYEVTTANLNKAVKRNIDRFPEDFMFQLNNDEFNLIFQNGTSNWGGRLCETLCFLCALCVE